MTKTQQRNHLIDRILTVTLQYENDRCCLSDHVHGDINQLRYYTNRYEQQWPDHPYRFFTVKGVMFAELLTDNITIDTDSVTLSDLDPSLTIYRKTDDRIVNGDIEQAVRIAELYDTLRTDPPEYHAAPMTRVTCDDPVIDHWIDGHVDMLTAIEHYDLNHPDRPKTPNGPAPVTIRHTAEMIRKDTP